MPSTSLAAIAHHIGSELAAEQDIMIDSVAPLDTSVAGQITFINNPKYLSKLPDCQATALIASPKMDTRTFQGIVLQHANPYLAYAKTVQLIYPEPRLPAVVHASAVIAEGVVLGNGVAIAPNVVIEAGCHIGDGVQIGAGCVIGADCRLADEVCLKPNVTLYSGVRIGERSRLHAGVVIGADGFGYAPDQGAWEKIPQVGSVVIGTDVEIGANTTIDRGALSDTVIGDGVIIDNQVQIGHNVIIGDHSAFAGASAVAGSTIIGKRCQVGGASAIAGHISIADDVIITGMSMVTNSITGKGVYSSGVPATDNMRWRKNAVRFTQLDELARSVRALEKQIQLDD